LGTRKTDIRWRVGMTDKINRQKRQKGLQGCEGWSMALKKGGQMRFEIDWTCFELTEKQGGEVLPVVNPW
jgi:hypothetical protein